jgi:hypothetical protein
MGQIKFTPWSVVKHNFVGNIYEVDDTGTWRCLNLPSFPPFYPGDGIIVTTIEDRKTFEENFSLLEGDYEDA